MNRPRRSLQHKSYEDPSDSDSQDEESLSSMEDSSDSLSEATASEEEPSCSEEIVRLPTTSEIIETHQTIRLQTVELAMVNLEYELTKQKLKIFKERRHSITQSILKSKSFLARVRAVPQEVLSLVFSFYADDLSNSPWTLMQVTRAWRAAAMCTRAIWRRIMITSPVWKEQGGKRRYCGREVCVSRRQLKRALCRAGNSPLDIVVDCHKAFTTIQTFEEMASVLSSPQTRSLLRQFEVRGAFASRLAGLKETSLNFPDVETLTISDHSLSQMTRALLKISNHIKNLSTTASSFLCYEEKDPVAASELKELHIDAYFVGEYISWENAEILRLCLQRASLLTTLEISDLRHRVLHPAPPIILPSLQVLVLRHSSVVWYLHTPALRTLTFVGECRIREAGSDSNKFPLLKSLKSSWYGGDLGLATSLKGVPLPSLQDLDLLCFGDPPKATVLEFISEHCRKLVTFRLEQAAIRKADLANLVCSMPLLEELELVGVSITKGFFVLFTPRSTSSKMPASRLPNSHHSFPRLTRLRVDLRGCPLRGQTKAIKAEAKNAIKARLKAGTDVHPEASGFTRFAPPLAKIGTTCCNFF